MVLMANVICSFPSNFKFLRIICCCVSFCHAMLCHCHVVICPSVCLYIRHMPVSKQLNIGSRRRCHMIALAL